MTQKWKSFIYAEQNKFFLKYFFSMEKSTKKYTKVGIKIQKLKCESKREWMNVQGMEFKFVVFLKLFMGFVFSKYVRFGILTVTSSWYIYSGSFLNLLSDLAVIQITLKMYNNLINNSQYIHHIASILPRKFSHRKLHLNLMHKVS